VIFVLFALIMVVVNKYDFLQTSISIVIDFSIIIRK